MEKAEWTKKWLFIVTIISKTTTLNRPSFSNIKTTYTHVHGKSQDRSNNV